MAFKRQGNSRDDKSAGSPKRSSTNSRTGKPSGPARGRGTNKGDASDNQSPFKKFEKSKPADKRAAGKSYSGRGERADRPARNFDNDGDKGPFSGRGGSKKPYSGRPDRSSSDRPARSFNKEGGEKRPYLSRGGDNKKPLGGRGNDGDKPRSYGAGTGKRGYVPRTDGGYKKRESGNYRDRPTDNFEDKPERAYNDRPEFDASSKTMRGRKKTAEPKEQESGLIRLNRYIANAGICSRRKADELIEAGVVSVNGEVISELGYKVNPATDTVRYNGETLKREKMVYVLLNKPKDYITTTDDPQERRTVMHLVDKASKERIYPVGRLDRNTTGLLLMTNDGDLADKLSHPRSNVVKLYQVELSKSLTQGDLNKIAFGLELEDGLIKPDSISYVQGGSKREVGIQIHSGKNRIVRRIFEHLGYEVVKLDRVVYAGLTKKDLPRGRWRYLEEKELIQLKHLL
ncbi:rRNA pseudouridine synthase [Mucilaginibacter limnophilus]|uniref:Pseudouridine synthase n=1 Tax=Mucilaginibacter limnophilus TaxID=1932778 RepID=A0A437MLQ2_9SPHI|nr:pseudouridine synthase [Mucilaginibacter limnophilus]RVT98526.1 rRNA pseudouridine synthase [Mucilaginibacter limnophilus]